MLKRKLVWVRGDQLFRQTRELAYSREVNQYDFLFIESKFFLNRYKYHKHKLMLVLGAMRRYRFDLENILDDNNYQRHTKSKIHYWQFDTRKTIEEIFTDLSQNYQHICFYETANDDIHIQKLIRNSGMKLEIWPNPSFYTSSVTKSNYSDKSGRINFRNFYINQRKQTGILLDEKGEALGGKWNFDEWNRKKLPKGMNTPELPLNIHDENDKKILSELETTLASEYSNNPGSFDNFWLPISQSSSDDWFSDFLGKRFEHFGDYEDAIVTSSAFLFHSVLSPLLNIGLLIGPEVVNQSVAYYLAHTEQISLNQVEGFVRQILGWREYILLNYRKYGSEQNKNFFNHHRGMSEQLYLGNTGIKPIDDTIKKILTYGYAHHIERLMIIGNFFLLLEISPEEVYRWYMQMFVDAYDWVMMPNIYGMSQFSDGGLMMTKPYISASNYILKMSNYKKNEQWTKIWDALFWEFLNKHREFFSRQARMSFLLKNYDRKSEIERQNYKKLKSQILRELTTDS